MPRAGSPLRAASRCAAACAASGGAAGASRVPAAIHLITPEKRLNKSLQQPVRGSSRLIVSRANRISRAARHDSLFTLSEDTP
ncbi:hypothetical protein BGLA2_390008 [Burkholderia gladioli]|nr:hypothetical protein BGLA2_390008 [Burkholderia gladioli]